MIGLLLCVVVLVVCLVLWRVRNRKRLELAKQLNCGIPCLPVVGHAYKFLGNMEVQMQAYQEFGRAALQRGGTTCMWILNWLLVVIADPVTADFSLKNYMDKGHVLRFTQDVLRSASLFAPVPIWRHRRKIMVPVFALKNLQQFAGVFAKQASIMTDKLSVHADKGPFSIWGYFTTYTMDSVGEATLGVKWNFQNNHDHTFLKAIDAGLDIVGNRVIRPWLQIDMLFRLTSAYRELSYYKTYLNKFIGDIIEQKRNEIVRRRKMVNNISDPPKLKSVLEILIDNSESEKGYNDLELLEEMRVLVVAANDTSATASSFITVMLARHPDIQDKVYQELYGIFGDSQRQVVHEDLFHMKYLDAVIRESLRLYPPVPMVVRESDRDLTLPSGITVPKGCILLHNIWAIHRNPQYWGDDAEEFRPERWVGDSPIKHPAQFMAFSYGPRNCIGYQFALSSAKVVISTLLRSYKVLPAEEPTISNGQHQHKPLRLKFGIMMKDAELFRVKLEKRIC